ncbi:MAG: DNA polymerase IV [Candidatus Omnitrophica bacterium]|nr:DNA polymerase IV [Candidatus Omnitrophota bacterium]
MSASTNSPLHLGSFPVPVLHADCDAFFTSVEQALRPELRGRPVVTGKERGIVACASYEAKALGIKRPMRIFEAQKIFPGVVCLPSDYETYSIYSKRMFDILRRFTPAVEEYSIDEAFAELAGLRRVYRAGFPEIAWRMKQEIQKELGLTVSVGLSASKTLAKIASKRAKPDGFTVIRARELHQILPSVKLEAVCGFGPNTVSLLEKNGVRNVWDYVARPEAWARKLLGKIGGELWHELRGEVVYPIVTAEKDDYASISKCKTFTPPSAEPNFVRAQLIRNFESAFIKLRRHGLSAKGIAVYLREKDFRTAGMEAELDRHTSSTLDAVGLAEGLFEKLFEAGKFYRLTGVVLFKLRSDRGAQYTLFDDVPRIESFRRIDRVIDEVNARYGKHALSLGPGLWLGKHRQHLAARGDLPARKKELFRGETFRQRLGLPVWGLTV